MVIVRKYWSVSEEVDKALLSQAVQDFCGHFPVFRLQEDDMNMFISKAAGVKDDGRTRLGKYSLDTNKLRKYLFQGCSVMLSSMILKKGIKLSLGLLGFFRLLFFLHFNFNSVLRRCPNLRSAWGSLRFVSKCKRSSNERSAVDRRMSDWLETQSSFFASPAYVHEAPARSARESTF